MDAVVWGRGDEGLAEEGEALPVDRPASALADGAVAALVETYAGVMFRVAHAVLRSRAEAEDVVQEAFLRVVRHRGSLGEVREMRVWLVRIAWRLALDRRRKLRPEQMDRVFAESLAARDVSADAAMAQAEEFARVLREMERLPRAEREVLALAATEEMSAAEMAAVVGRSESAVRALLFRARARLKERLGVRR